MLKVYTSRINCKDKDKFDITVKTGSKIFAPTWDIVMGLKNGKITQEQYEEEYHRLMVKSYNENREEWNKLLSRDRVVLVCFCRSGDFCHRYLLAKYLVKLGAEYKGEIK
jgi:uncharacterized protein YeaO (DUF488 family)